MGGGAPLLKARCGETNLQDQRATLPQKRGGRNPRWGRKQNNVMKLKRHANDDDILVIEMWDWDRQGRDTFIGVSRVAVQKYMDSPNQEFDEELTLSPHDRPDAGNEEPSALISVKIKWLPQVVLEPDAVIKAMLTREEGHELPERGVGTEPNRTEPTALRPTPGYLQVVAKSARGVHYPSNNIRDLSTCEYATVINWWCIKIGCF
eukprot:SAG11_NODE_447_length_9395_cov_4.121665_1_plen_206_part_00